MNDKKSYAISFLHHASFYYKLVKASLKESINHNNQWIVLIDNPDDKDEYKRKTSWSDFEIIMPVLFCFLHALELTLKGLIHHVEKKPKQTHRLIELYDDCKELIPDESRFFDILEFYIKPSKDSILANFFNENEIDINVFSESLRYPTDKYYSKSYNYLEMLYQEQNAIPFFTRIVEDIDKIQEYSREIIAEQQ